MRTIACAVSPKAQAVARDAGGLRIGNLLNQTELGRDTGISQPQIHRFMNLLDVSFQAIRLPAYSVNRTRRLIKAPKLYWSDAALALFQVGRVEPQIRPLTGQRPVEEGMHALVDLLAQLGNLRLADPRQPHRLHQIVDPPG